MYYLNIAKIVLRKVVLSSNSVPVCIGGNCRHNAQNSMDLLVSNFDTLKFKEFRQKLLRHRHFLLGEQD
jgi:hypothetical protein